MIIHYNKHILLFTIYIWYIKIKKKKKKKKKGMFIMSLNNNKYLK